ncbi:MAG: hypothetical protein K9N55_06245 [Phycisphaerae bacterium]|nr:hypothetical protein [Phycisphaerae bacterium]
MTATCVNANPSLSSYNPKHITANKAWRMIKHSGLGTASELPGANTLLITGTNTQRKNVLTLLDLIDTTGDYSVLFVEPKVNSDESVNNLKEAYTQLSIGSLAEPPAKASGIRVILEPTDAKILVVAPTSWTDRINTVLVNGPAQGKPATASVFTPRVNQTFAAAEVIEPDPAAKTILRDTPGRISDATRLASIDPIPLTPGAQPAVQKPQDTTIVPVRAVASHVKQYQTPALANGEMTLDMELPETMPIVALIDLVGKHLQLDFMYDEKEVEGDVTLKLEGALSGPVKVKNLYPLLESVMKFRGYVMTRRGDVVTVVKSDNWAEVDPDLRDNGGLIEFGEAVMTCPFKLKHISTSDAESLLDSMKLGLAKSSIAENKTLIITAYSYRMPRIEALLDMVDQPGEPKVFRSRSLNYTMAQNLTDKVRGLAEQLSNIEISVSSSVISEDGEQAIPPKRPTETTAAYNRRVQLARNAQAARRAAALRSGTSTQQDAGPEEVYLDADKRTNSILMIGREEQLAIVQDLIDTLDVEQQDPRTPMVYELKNVDAQEMRNKFQELGIIGGYSSMNNEMSGRITAGAGSRTAQGATSAATRTTPTTGLTDNMGMGMGMGMESTDAALLEEPQVVVIEQTNSLLVRATPEQHTQIAQLLKFLDSTATDSAVPYAIYSLKNTDPEELAAILQKLIEETIMDKEGKIEKVVRKIDDQIVIVPDQNTFSLIVYASNRNQTWIKSLIDTLDKRRPQVLIDVTLVEVSKTDEFNYDINLLESFPDLTSTSGVTSALMPGAVGTNLVDALMNSGRDHFVDMQSGGGSGTAFYADKHINALLTAMESKNYGRILAKPKILVNDNATGTIKTEDKTYVKTTGSTLTDTTGTTSGALTTSEQYNEYSAGITLDITPHISDGDLLRLEIALTRSDFGAKSSENGPPNLIQSDLNTIVTVPDQSTIILGGMVKLNQSKSVSKVPLLGDLPLIGGLFRGSGKSDIQKKLYVFVKAEVIRPDESLTGKSAMVEISDRNRKAFEEHEAEFQGFEGWPGLKGKPMGPDKVLDME